MGGRFRRVVRLSKHGEDPMKKKTITIITIRFEVSLSEYADDSVDTMAKAKRVIEERATAFLYPVGLTVKVAS
jgi:hypothetical protein